MKKLLLLFCSFLSFLSPAQNSPSSIGEFLYTVPVIPYHIADVENESWWNNSMEYSTREKFIQPILDLVYNGGVTVYYPEYPFDSVMDKSTAQRLIHRVDTVYTNYYYDNEYYLNYSDIYARDVRSITFHEEWLYDSTAKILLKKVRGIILNIEQSSYDGGNNKGSSLFYIPFNGKSKLSGQIPNDPESVRGITSDFHSHGYRYFNSDIYLQLYGDSSMQIKEETAVRKIIQSLPSGKKTVFYDTLYPYNKVIDKKIAKGKLSDYKSANSLRFFEDWEVRFSDMSFTKTVHGVVLMNRHEFIADNEISFVKKRIVFIPVNNYVPTADILPGQKFSTPIVYSESFFDTDDIHNNKNVIIDSVKMMNVCLKIVDLTKEHKLIVYPENSDFIGDDPWSAERKPLSVSNTDSLMANVNFKEYFKYADGYWGPRNNSIAGLSFYEDWYFDATTNHFTKNIRTVGILTEHMLDKSGLYFLLPYTNTDLPVIKDTATIMRPEFLVAENIMCPVTIVNAGGGPLFESYNTQEGGTLNIQNNIETSQRYLLIQTLINDALAGKLKVYGDDKASTILSPVQLQTKLDSLSAKSPVTSDVSTDYLFINELVFNEDWYFNPATGEFYKKVNSVTFVNHYAAYDENYVYTERVTPVFTLSLK